jgi:hypothetical protein
MTRPGENYSENCGSMDDDEGVGGRKLDAPMTGRRVESEKMRSVQRFPSGQLSSVGGTRSTVGCRFSVDRMRSSG